MPNERIFHPYAADETHAEFPWAGYYERDGHILGFEDKDGNFYLWTESLALLKRIVRNWFEPHAEDGENLDTLMQAAAFTVNYQLKPK